MKTMARKKTTKKVEKNYNDDTTALAELRKLVSKFCRDREWDQFHGAKDLAIGLTTESAELLEIFRFQTQNDIDLLLKDSKKRQDIANELADCLFFLLRFSERYSFNLSDSLVKKLALSGQKYPVEKFRGSNRKYNE